MNIDEIKANVTNYCSEKYIHDDSKIIIWELMCNYIQNNLYKRYKYIGYRLGFDYEDFYSIAYIGFENSIKKYNDINSNKKKGDFFWYCINSCAWYCSDYLKKFKSHKHKIMDKNNMISFSLENEEYFLTNEKFIGSKDTEEKMLDSVFIDDILIKLNEKLNKSKGKNNIESKFLELKLANFSSKEIREILKINSKEISRINKNLKEEIRSIL